MDQTAGGQVRGQGAVECLEHRGATSSRRSSAQGGWVDVEDLDAPERPVAGVPEQGAVTDPQRERMLQSQPGEAVAERAGVHGEERRTHMQQRALRKRAAARDPDVRPPRPRRTRPA